MNVAGYVRVSTEQQRDEGSHIQQRERLEVWADREGHKIEVFEDVAISGQADERPEFEQMMERCLQGDFDAVSVRELSRFGRSLKRVLQDIEQLGEADVEFISITESFDTSSAMGKAMMQMIGVFNEFWANLARERALENVEQRRREGKPIGRPRKLNEDQISQVRKWHEDNGMGYSTIAKLAKVQWDVQIDRSTIWRYCNEET